MDKDLFFLYLQLDNADEQAAQVRRELDGRLQVAEENARVRFTSHSSKIWPSFLLQLNSHFLFIFYVCKILHLTKYSRIKRMRGEWQLLCFQQICHHKISAFWNIIYMET